MHPHCLQSTFLNASERKTLNPDIHQPFAGCRRRQGGASRRGPGLPAISQSHGPLLVLGSEFRARVDRIWVPLKGLYRDYIGIMEKKMETTINGLFGVSGSGFRVYRAYKGLGLCLGFRVFRRYCFRFSGCV